MAQETVTANDILRQSLDRNRYFYGKLMTVRDFTQEQLYFNAKRWLINRLLFGSGVICGLEVSAAPEPTKIVIDHGLALDPLGREVTVLEIPGGNLVDLTQVIPVPTTPTVDVNGFICLSHRECPKDPVPSLKASACDEGCESNRWSETFDVSWDVDTGPTVAPSLCQSWLNRTTVSAEAEETNLKVERTTPLWVRANEVFEVVVRVTAKNEGAKNITISEDLTNATPVEPDPSLHESGQFPTPPVNLAPGEFFVYIYQVKATETEDGGSSKITVNLKADGLPALTSTIDVLDDNAAKTAERQFLIESDCGDEPKSTCVRIAKLKARFENSKLVSFTIEDFAEPRFRYSLEHVTEMLECLRASFLAEAGSPRPGHAFITFNDLETREPQPIGARPAPGSAFTATRGDHVHTLLFADRSGLEFVPDTNDLRINGEVGGDVTFLKVVKGIKPEEANDLVTKDYVDAHIAGLDWQESVLSKELTAPPHPTAATETTPATPKEGDRYLLFYEPTDTWKGKSVKGKKNDIATFNGKNWDLTTPDKGTATFVEDEQVAYLFIEKNWIPFLATPEVASGDGLTAHDAIFSVGKGDGIVVSKDSVAVDFDQKEPRPIGLVASPGSSKTVSDGDHVHTLPLSKEGEGPGLVFDAAGLRIEGPVAGAKINFLNQVAGQDPKENRHLATKKYVDDNLAGIEAGDGLVRKDKVISVGQGEGIKVSADSVAVVFETGPPKPIGPAAIPGTAKTASPGDHVHTLRLSDPASGLVIDDKGLRIDGLAGGKTNFVNPVAGPDPSLAEHFATKRYVDKQIVPPPPVIAGKGLVSADHTISVGQGDGILVGEDSVAVRFSDLIPQPDSEEGDRGKEPAVSRGDHVHPRPTITTGSASGIVTFRFQGNAQFTAQADVSPGLGANTISVELAFVTGPSSYAFGVDLNSNLPRVPPMELTAEVRAGAREQLTSFRILVDSSRSENSLPQTFQIRWFAYSAAVERPATEVVIPPETKSDTLIKDQPEL